MNFKCIQKERKRHAPSSFLGIYVNKNDIVYNYLQMCVGGHLKVSIINSIFACEKDEQWWRKTGNGGMFTLVETCSNFVRIKKTHRE